MLKNVQKCTCPKKEKGFDEIYTKRIKVGIIMISVYLLLLTIAIIYLADIVTLIDILLVFGKYLLYIFILLVIYRILRGHSFLCSLKQGIYTVLIFFGTPPPGLGHS